MKLPKLKRGDIVEVHWRDHWGSAGWVPLSQVKHECINISVQYFYKVQDGYLLGYQAADSTGENANGVTGVLVKDITKIRKVK